MLSDSGSPAPKPISEVILSLASSREVAGVPLLLPVVITLPCSSTNAPVPVVVTLPVPPTTPVPEPATFVPVPPPVRVAKKSLAACDVLSLSLLAR